MRIAAVAASLLMVLAASTKADTITTTTTTEISLDEVRPPALTPVAEKPFETNHTPEFRVGAAFGPGVGIEAPAVGTHLQIGGAIAHRVLLMVGASITADFRTSSTLSTGDHLHHAETLGVQYWPLRRVWVEGGAGIGDQRVSKMTLDTKLGPAITAAVGVEPLMRPTYSIGVQLRMTLAAYDVEHAGFPLLLIGMSWY